MAPVTPRALAGAALREAASRRARILAGDPHPDPATRTVAAARRELRDQVTAQLDAVRREAEHAARRAEEARRRLGILDRVFPMAAAREAARTGEEAQRARRRADLAHETRGDDYRAAEERAPDLARQRQREHDAYEKRPDVQLAREEDRLDRRVAAGIRAGDDHLADLVAADCPEAAREEVRRREEEERRERERRLAEERRRERELARQLALQAGGGGPQSSGPRPRR